MTFQQPPRPLAMILATVEGLCPCRDHEGEPLSSLNHDPSASLQPPSTAKDDSSHLRGPLLVTMGAPSRQKQITTLPFKAVKVSHGVV